MNTLKRMTVALLAVLPLATGVAAADTEHGYSRIFIFGASFMDSGNHFILTGESAHPPFVPVGPSYPMGGHNFSNGPTWVEVVAAEMKLRKGAKPAFRHPTSGNYAVGYGRAREDADDILPSLYDQVQAWRDNGYCTYTPMDDTLFIMDSAYFDLIDLVNNPEDSMSVLGGMTNSIDENIGILYECGARNLLFAYIPPLEASPMVPQPANPPVPSGSWIYNYMFLAPVLESYASEPDMNVSVVDFFAFVSGMLATHETFGLTNVTDSCITFGVTKGAFCKNRDEYFFWDPLHPTKTAHALMAEEALRVLSE